MVVSPLVSITEYLAREDSFQQAYPDFPLPWPKFQIPELSDISVNTQENIVDWTSVLQR